MEQADLENIKSEAQKAFSAAKNPPELETVFRQYLGGGGPITRLFKEVAQLPVEQKKEKGRAINQLKALLEKARQQREKEFRSQSGQAPLDIFDPDKPGRPPRIGRLHPLTQTKREMMAIFASMGFAVAQGPEIEDEWHNFDALHIPADHPARDAWNTIWLKPESEKRKAHFRKETRFGEQSEKLLLRTHTSPVQVRYLMTHQPPLRVIVPGKVFRYEATDVRHEYQFYQLEGLMVDRQVSAANFKAVIGEFFQRFFDRDLKFRLRPDFFPFTEPSFDIAMTCLTCGGKGRSGSEEPSGSKSCLVCKKTGWLEVAGAGMVHPHVFEASGLDPKIWKGWAFGFGWDRLTMMKYKIDDIRLFNSGNLRFLEQF